MGKIRDIIESNYALITEFILFLLSFLLLISKLMFLKNFDTTCLFVALSSVLAIIATLISKRQNHSSSDLQNSPQTSNLIPAECITDSRPQAVSTTKAGTQEEEFCKNNRKEILSDIKQKLKENGSKLVLLNGMGGIGKTEICRSLFKLCCENGLSNVEKVGWLTFYRNLPTTFFKKFPDINEIKEDNEIKENEYFKQTRDYINGLGSKLLLFIDNANDISDDDIRWLSEQRNCKLILTSRLSEVGEFSPIHVDRLEMPACLELYREHSQDGASPNETIQSIIELADRHTLAVVLLAKTQRATHKTSQEFLELLQKKRFNLAEIKEPIVYEHNPEAKANTQQKRKARFNDQLVKVFDIAEIDEESLWILKLFSVLAYEPLEYQTVKEWFPLEDFVLLNKLIETGWLMGSKEGVAMHPVIAAVIQDKAKPTYEEGHPLVGNLAESLHLNLSDSENIFTNVLPTFRHAVSVGQYLSGDDLPYAEFSYYIGFVYNYLGKYDEAQKWNLKTIEINENVLGKQHQNTAASYANSAEACRQQGKYDEALEWNKKALEIHEKALGTDPFTAAQIYKSVYQDQGKNDKVQKWLYETLDYITKIYNNIGLVYFDKGKQNKHDMQGLCNTAMERYNKALDILEKILEKDNSFRALVYNNIGEVYLFQSTIDGPAKLDEALEWHLKALEIDKRELEEEHRNIASDYNNIGLVYFAKGMHLQEEEWFKKALEYFQMALVINKKVLGEDHPDTNTNSNSITMTSKILDNFDSRVSRLMH